MIWSVLICFLSAIITPTLLNRAGRSAAPWTALVPIGLFAFFLQKETTVEAGSVLIDRFDWVPSLGVQFSFYLDGLSLLFSLLILSVGAVVLIFAHSYLGKDPQKNRFYAFTFFFMGAMLGLVLASNLLTLFIFWELTSVGSFLLIGYKNEKSSARDSALQALLITGTGGLALLAAFILIGSVYGTYEITEIFSRPDVLISNPLYIPVLLLICIAAFTKSAQFPFHFWLPGAMSAPAPVSAYLHSATMVKAGIYLLARLNPLLGGTESWHYILTITGAVTMLLGALMAFPQRDLKRLLAYSTVSALGTLVLLLGLDTSEAMKAAVVFLLVHAFYKSSLFLVVGILDHEVGTRDRSELGGLFPKVPMLGVFALLAALSMAGLPPLLGFIGKELLYEAKIQAPAAAPLITGAGVAANAVMVALAGIVGFIPFFGRKIRTNFQGRIPSALLVGPAFFATGGLVIGLFPSLIDRWIISQAVSAIRAEQTVIELYLWHGFSPVLLLSIATVTVGITLLLFRELLFSLFSRIQTIPLPGPSALYEFSLSALKRIASVQTDILQNGYLRIYISCFSLAFIGLGTYVLWRSGPIRSALTFEIWPHELALAIVIAAAALASILVKSRLGAVITVGVVGYGVAILFVFFGAPDLAITQFLVETLTVILFIYVLYKLPAFRQLSTPVSRGRDALIAIASGTLITIFVLLVLSSEGSSEVTTFYGTASWLQAYGRNVVNVILVDFRALDTLGEILVLSLAAIGVYSLMKRKEKTG
jgi:multicomponent Na+:H+ antiporter subunit A